MPDQSNLPPFMHLNRPDAAADVTHLDDGSIIMTCPRPLPPHPDSLIEHLLDNARDVPDRTFLAERENNKGDWIHMTWGQCLARADAVAQWLLDQGFGPNKPVMILSENSLAQAAMMFGAMSVSAPLVQVSPAYSLLSTDYDKLKYIYDLTDPALIMVEDGTRFAKALAALPLGDTPVVCVKDHLPNSIDFAELLATPKTAAVDDARAKITLDTVAKILFTSGSTGMPKGVINTHRMMLVVQSMLEDIRDAGNEDAVTVVLDWLPWHHTFGGNATMNSILRNAGTLYIDSGRPVPGLFEQTINNLREINPTFFSCVPGAYTMLAEALEDDADLRKFFFSRLTGMSYGGAALPQALYERMQKLAIAEIGQRINISTGYGATETGALNTAVYWTTARMGMLGLPMAEVQLKLIPLGQTDTAEKFELHVKGPQITPGYYKRPDLDADAFDGEGWFKTGDAVTWVDESDPLQSLSFAGRVTEDFKLTSGTWVHTGSLRVEVLAALSPLAGDALICGHNRDHMALAIWPNPSALKALAPDADPATYAGDPAVLSALKEKIDAWNQANPGNSRRIHRALFMLTPPSIDAGEITDKRYINQRVALDIRAAEVERLYADEIDAGVVSG
ncbi:MAG: AMP-binding protein [Alphaproteobacteria bacterium]|jgi:feruloyl-CoA synthase|nr:AMP-binding protein [Alphaproteobacteria bacterium]MBT4967273.1 AMP-binding protein [Alphaproteobacteria bacterium]MBT5160484.1 AMP-binding protein [Alphaproteobacteria bacterium]MBT5917438.1 AMP-binding protein [Alphaproteobacteria bacterium]